MRQRRRKEELRQAIQQLATQVAAVQIAPAQAAAPQIRVYEPIDIKGDVAMYNYHAIIKSKIRGPAYAVL